MAARIYRTVQGDAFDAVAFRLWGDERMARRLIEANPEYADVLVFSAGVELLVPDATPSTTVPRLPAWYA